MGTLDAPQPLADSEQFRNTTPVRDRSSLSLPQVLSRPCRTSRMVFSGGRESQIERHPSACTRKRETSTSWSSPLDKSAMRFLFTVKRLPSQRFRGKMALNSRFIACSNWGGPRKATHGRRDGSHRVRSAARSPISTVASSIVPAVGSGKRSDRDSSA